MAESQVELNEEVNELYDFYHDLLTTKQATYLDLYYGQDLSLGEIAEEFAVSRQAVYDNVKRTVQLLRRYEGKLHLISQFHNQVNLVGRLAKISEERYHSDQDLKEIVSALEHLIDSQ